MSVVDDHKILIKENPQGKLYVYWDEYSGRVFLHIRYWYLDKKDGIEKPSSKGIAVPSYDIANVLQAVAHCLQNKPDDPPPRPERKDQKKRREERQASEAKGESNGEG